MEATEVKTLIESQLSDSQVITEGEGCDFRITVISPQFAGLGTVKRQQLVYGCINDRIADGSIHAVTLKTYTPDQYQKLQS